MIAIALALFVAPMVQGRTPEVSLGPRTAAITEPFSDVMGMAELPDGRVIVSDRVEQVFTLADFATGERRRISRNGTGPNEYLMPFGPIRWRGDTLLGFDPNNRRYTRILANGTIAGSLPFPNGRANGITSWATPRAVDPQGRVYWDSPILDMQPVVKRSMRARIIRWQAGSDAPPEVVMEFSDHGEFEHAHRYRPMPQTDAWVLDAQGRIGILSAAEYRLRWYKDGTVVETGPPIAFTPTRVSRAERDAFRAKKALEPASGVSMGGRSNSPARTQDPARVRAAWPDSIFPEVMPPFEPSGVRLAPNGDVWVTRTGPASQQNARVDILDPKGALRATLRLPPRTRLISLGERGVYLLNTDADGFQVLERHAYPAIPR